MRWKLNKIKLINAKRLIIKSAQASGIMQPYAAIYAFWICLCHLHRLWLQCSTEPQSIGRGKSRDQNASTKAGDSLAATSRRTYDTRRWNCQICIQVWKQVTFSSFSLFPFTPTFFWKRVFLFLHLVTAIVLNCVSEKEGKKTAVTKTTSDELCL